eukprot:CAMPEP_0181361676 /NCGR_PEP_ID=MMETSP1106-20121128/7474_1 /TAXON_ID=81844 /ORGANISM="Mantoniella antarctica, Strain SL-175" /LENGTH=61 /DNA_ID=CAMNT_0023475327 /DNA_START=28 /DNA_END=210 /DNA_ORIENTATION=-
MSSATRARYACLPENWDAGGSAAWSPLTKGGAAARRAAAGSTGTTAAGDAAAASSRAALAE